jgi:hypothetical protein
MPGSERINPPGKLLLAISETPGVVLLAAFTDAQ